MRKYDRDLLDCKCGANARYRYKIPVHWVECSRKKCPYDMRTGYFQDTCTGFDQLARDRAFIEWNKMVLTTEKR